MNLKEFWMDVLRAAAIIGVAMAVSHIFEQYMLLFSGVNLVTASIVIFVEGLVAAVLFVWAMFYFTRRVARVWNDSVELSGGIVAQIPFTYGRAVSYVLLISMFVGLLVGVVNTIFVDVMGDDAYRAAQIAYFEQIAEVLNAYASMSGGETLASSDMMAQQIEMWESMERPSMFANILSFVTSYMFYGGVTALVVAALARRKRAVKNDSK